MTSSARLTLVMLLICVLGTALLLDGRKKNDGTEAADDQLAAAKGDRGGLNIVTTIKPPTRPIRRNGESENPNRILFGPKGAVIEVPPRKDVAPPVPIKEIGSRTYTVIAGDNWWVISKRKYGSHRYVSLLRKANPKASSQRYLSIGQKLILPSVGSKVRELEQLEQSQKTRRAPKSAPARRLRGGRRVHVVATGDKLWNLARRFLGSGAKYWMILDANRGRIANPDRLRVGTRLVMPAAR